MRLLRRLKDGRLQLTNRLAADVLHRYPYAILSHTWSKDDNEEINYQDFKNGSYRHKLSSYTKIQFCAKQASQDQLEYFWVDTCCIDRTSSEELQESITSMFAWYRNASKCYAYLTDVSVVQHPTPRNTYAGILRPWEPGFRKSRWFRRGWTLQELLAPREVEFFSVEGNRLGDKKSLEQCLYEITGIPHRALQGHDLCKFSVEERLRWSASRETKRREDKAYSLLGIFNVSMGHMYGEGEHSALDRLQHAIEKREAEIARQDQILATLPFASGAAFDSQHNKHQPTCLMHTRTELLAAVDRWSQEPDDKHICWLRGMAGTGKSTIARTISSTYDDRGTLAGSFYFSRGSDDLSNGTKFVTTLARQLATAVPQTKRYICEAVIEHKSIARQSLRDQWNRLIYYPLSKLDSKWHLSPLLFIVDGLDECDDGRDLKDILRVLTTARSPPDIRLRILLSSRPELPIHSSFLHVPDSKRHILVLDEQSHVQVNRDIKLFFERHFRDIREERGLPEDWPKPHIIENLVGSSCGLFIWSSTACRFINKGNGELERRMSILMNGGRSDADPKRQLDQIYTTVLRNAIPRRSNDVQNLRDNLGCIVTLCSALPINALAELLKRRPHDIQTSLASLQAIFHLPNDPSVPIRLHHPTFRDFLLDKSRCSVPDLCVDEKQIHKRLADSCIDYMSYELQKLAIQLDSSQSIVKHRNSQGTEIHVSHAFRYACLYWIEHYRRSGTHLRDGDRAHLFFQQFFGYWVLIMNLMEKGSEIGALMRLYQSLLSSSQNTRQLPLVVLARRYIASQPQTALSGDYSQHSLTSSLVLDLPSEAQLWLSSWNRIVQNKRAEALDWKDIKDETNYVNDLAFTPDSRGLASGSNSEAVRLWDLKPQIAIRKLEDNFTEKVSSVCISLDGGLLAAGSDDSTVKLWDLKTAKVRHTLRPQAGWVNSVLFSPKGNILVSGSMDGKVVLWDTATGQELIEFDNQSRSVNSMSFCPDGSIIATGSDDDFVRLWSMADKLVKLKRAFNGHGQSVNSVKFSPDGTHVLFGSDDATVKLWKVSTEECITFEGHSKKVTTVAFSPDSQLIASGSEDATVRIWDASNGDSLRTLRDHKCGIHAVAFSPDGRILASGSFDDEVRLWNTSNWTSRMAPTTEP